MCLYDKFDPRGIFAPRGKFTPRGGQTYAYKWGMRQFRFF